MNKRFERYIHTLQELKERKTPWEILERELIFEFIRINDDRISDFPLNPLQQRTVVNTICQWSKEYIGRKYIKRIIDGFVSDLSRFSGATEYEQDHSEKLQTLLGNSESLLIRCIQSVINTVAVVIDNCQFVLQKYYGSEAMTVYAEIEEKHELSANFWRAVMDHFIKLRVSRAYEHIIQKSHFTYSKAPNSISINFYFDHVLDELLLADEEEEEEQQMTAYVEKQTEEYDYDKAKNLVLDYLKGVRDVFLDKDATDADLNYVAEIVCIDYSFGQYENEDLNQLRDDWIWEQGLEAGKEGSKEPVDRKEQEARVDFLKEQVLSTAVGAACTLATVSRGFMAAAKNFIAREMEVLEMKDLSGIRRLVGNFDIESLDKAFMFIVQKYYLGILTRKSLDKRDKVLVRTVYRRRVSIQEVDALFETGMTKIRRRNLFMPDPSNKEMLIFRQQVPAKLKEQLALLNVEQEFARRMAALWKVSQIKVEFQVIVDTRFISKSAVDLKKGLAEILYKYGIVR